MAEIHITEQTEPSTPQVGKTKMYIDSADSHLKTKDSAGVIIDVTDTTIPLDNCRVGFLTYSDLGTHSTAIVHTGGVDTVLTNDEAGAQTIKSFAPIGITDVWDKDNARFDFSELGIGDMVDIRLDLVVTTTANNQDVRVDLELGQGGFSYTIPFEFEQIKSAGSAQVSRYNGIYIGDSNTRDNFGQFIFSSPSNATIVINGWYCEVLIRG